MRNGFFRKPFVAKTGQPNVQCTKSLNWTVGHNLDDFVTSKMQSHYLSKMLRKYFFKCTVLRNEHGPKMFLLFSHLINENFLSLLTYLKS